MSEPPFENGSPVVVTGDTGRSDIHAGMKGTVLAFYEVGYVIDFPSVLRSGLCGGTYFEPSQSWLPRNSVTLVPIVNDTNPT